MTDEQISLLIDEFKTPKHVRRHCAKVAEFAVELGEQFIKKGIKIDLTLLRHAALLHDIVRVVDFRHFEPEKFPDPVTPQEVELWKRLREKYKGMHHADAGADILQERGFLKEATLVRKHRFVQIAEGFETWEEKLLYYADKRVKHDKVVPLKERLEDGRKRNAPEKTGKISSKELDKKVFELEKEILSHI